MNMIDVNNTFSPAQEIMDPARFAGRKEVLEHALKALATAGASILVYGDRGVGKTSFVEMVKLVAQDQVELIYRHRLSRFKPPQGFQYKVVSIECDEDTDTIEKMLQRLITSPEGIRGLVGPRMQMIEKTTKNKYVLNILKNLMVVDNSFEEKVTLKEFEEKSVFELFTNLILIIVREVLDQEEGLLIVVDEFDQVKNTTGFSGLIKTLSKNKVKFLISGIANSYSDLIRQHASIPRQLSQGNIKISPMRTDEILNLFDLVEQSTDGFVAFASDFKNEVIEKSRGFPYYVQLFGYLALQDFVDIHGNQKRALISKDYLIRGLEHFTSHEPRYDEQYLCVIGDDPGRELLLKALAMQSSETIRESSPFRYCEKRGLRAPKKTLSTLLAHKIPEVLQRVDQETVRFCESLFRIYVNVRKPVLLKETLEGYCVPGEDVGE